MARSKMLCGAAVLAVLGLVPAAAFADGPCTNDIAQLGRQLGSQVGLGAPVSEPGAGQHVDKNMGAQQANGTASDRAQPGGASRVGGGSPGTVGGVAGPVGTAAGGQQANAVASGQVATSPEDVRRQSEGKPTTAQQAAQGGASPDASPADKVSQAKMALQRAVDLNAKGDASCMGAINDARNLMKGR
ncbi:MAG: hypothetical protein JO157_05265 [Acetobacteraceae bacterium]|nr:hypothetical protein [Acetobacteraceae bacterium]